MSIIPIQKPTLKMETLIGQAVDQFFATTENNIVSECTLEYRNKEDESVAFLNFIDKSSLLHKQRKKQEMLRTSIYNGYLDWVQPLNQHLCKRGDVIEFKSKIDEVGKLVDDIEIILKIHIPHERSTNWVGFLNEQYEHLYLLYDNIQLITFVVDFKRLKQIYIHVKINEDKSTFYSIFNMDPESRLSAYEHSYQRTRLNLTSIRDKVASYIDKRRDLHCHRFYATRPNPEALFQLSDTAEYRFKLG